MKSTAFRGLGELERDVQYRITAAEKIPTEFRDKVHLDPEGFGWVLLTDRFNRYVTSDLLRKLSESESGLVYKSTRNVGKLHPFFVAYEVRRLIINGRTTINTFCDVRVPIRLNRGHEPYTYCD